MSNIKTLDVAKVSYYLEAPQIPYAFSFDRKPMVIYKNDFKLPIFTSANPKAPVKDWPMLLTQELPMNETFYAAYKRGDGTLGDIAELYQCSKVFEVPKVMPPKGLEVGIWKAKFASIADFEKKTPPTIAQAEGISLIRKPTDDQPFALRFRGRIRFPDTQFKLYLTSDDGSALKINGVTVINNDGLHAASAKVSGIRAIDGFYDLEVLYFDAGGASSLKLEYESATVTRRPVPADWFYEPAK